jgi:transketolase C-terminal domain/subunit
MHADVVALDGEVGNSTYAEIFGEAHPDRYFEMFIAEQQMVATAVGMQVAVAAVRVHASRRSCPARPTSSAWPRSRAPR